MILTAINADTQDRTGSGSMKGLSRKKFLPSRQKLLAASYAPYPKPRNAHHHASY